jgi:hypothetical protein
MKRTENQKNKRTKNPKLEISVQRMYYFTIYSFLKFKCGSDGALRLGTTVVL